MAIVIVLAADETGHRHLMDREALAQWLVLSEITIRRHCKPTKRDPRTGRLFYDAEACREQLDGKVFARGKECEDGVTRSRRL